VADRILVIDANRKGKGPPDPFQTGLASLANPKWRAVWHIAQALHADLVWQSAETPLEPRGGYDVLVFNRVLPAIRANAAWLAANPQARIVHITNDYLVGGGALYVAAWAGRRPVEVIANFPRSLAPVTSPFVHGWTEVNLNALLYEAARVRPENVAEGAGCVYYGACRPERHGLFRKYLTGHVAVAQYPEVCREFEALGISGPWAGRIDWPRGGLYPWHASLYLWNTDANGHYRFLTNRFYEALSYDLYPIFPEETRWVFEQSGYYVPPDLVVQHADAIPQACAYADAEVMGEWRAQAAREQQQVLATIRRTIRGGTHGA
jgi:hypothetical protein